MPIEIAKLAEVGEPLSERILAFLGNDRSKAFSLLEIYADVEGFDEAVVAMVLLTIPSSDREREFAPYRHALVTLEEEKRVRSATYQGQAWYAATD